MLIPTDQNPADPGVIYQPKKTGTASELTVTVRDDEKKVVNKFLFYEAYCLSEDDPIIKASVGKTLEDYGVGEPTDITVKVKLTLL